MIAPLPGLSTLAHLIIIAVKKTADFASSSGEKSLQRGSVKVFPSQLEERIAHKNYVSESKIKSRWHQERTKMLSTLIIEAVLLFMIGSSYAIISAGISSNQFNGKVVEEFIVKVDNYYACNNSPNVLSAVCLGIKQPNEVLPQRSTLNLINDLAADRIKN